MGRGSTRGSEAGARCARCCQELPGAARFCPRCGARVDGAEPAAALPDAVRRLIPPQYADRLLGARGRPTAERRVITILFADVKGSTALAERLDPEDVMEIMNGAFAALLEPVYRYEGTLARLMGDGMLCFFGAPLAHEDDPERACHCAIALLLAARAYGERLRRERGLPGFEVRVGIHTGLVVVGEVGDDLRVEYTAMGDAVNLAARMEALAEPGTALLSGSTQSLVWGEFETVALGARPIRGRAQPVSVFRLGGPRPVTLSAARRGASEPELVGRGGELAVLHALVAGAAAGRGSAAVLMGEAGIGKSRLVAETRARWPLPERWFETRCLAHEENTSYGVARRLLQAMLATPPGTSPRARRRALWMRLSGSLGSAAARRGPGNANPRMQLRRAFAHLARLLEPLPADAAERWLPGEDAERLRLALHEGFRRLVRAMADQGPLALVWEDLHFGDASSLALLKSLFALDGDLPILLLVTSRFQEGPAQEPWLRTGHAGRLPCHRFDLERLSPENGLRLASSLVDVSHLPPGMLERLASTADGNPFFLEQLIGCVRDVASEVPTEDSEHRRTLLAGIQVPATIQGVITARLDRLDPESRRVLQLASLFGWEFSGRALARLCEPELSATEVARALHDLCERRFLRADGAADDHAFHHLLTSEVAYHSMLVSERRRLHARVARVLQDLDPERLDERAESLAHHCEMAGELEAALRFALRAAARANRLCAYRESIAHYRTALRLRSASPPTGTVPARAVGGELARLHERLGDAYNVVGDHAQALASFEQALAFTPNPHGRAALQRRIGAVLEKQGRYREARETLEAAVEAMAADLDPAEAARIFSVLGLVYYRTRDLANAAEIGELALSMLEPLDDQRATAQACNNLALICAERGELARAHAFHERGLTLWETAREPYGLAAAHHNFGLTLRREGDLRGAVRHLEEAARLFSKLGNGYGLARAHDSLGCVHLELGELAESQDHMERAAALLAELTVGETGVVSEMWQSGAW